MSPDEVKQAMLEISNSPNSLCHAAADAIESLEAQLEQVKAERDTEVKLQQNVIESQKMQLGELRVGLVALKEDHKAELTALREENKRLLDVCKFTNTLLHDKIVANQSAWIEWRYGRGLEAAMQWTRCARYLNINSR